MREVCGLWAQVNLLWLRNISKEAMAMLGMEYHINVGKKTLREYREYGRRWYRNGSDMNGREQQYLQVKSQPKYEKYPNGSGGRFPTGKRFKGNGIEIRWWSVCEWDQINWDACAFWVLNSMIRWIEDGWGHGMGWMRMIGQRQIKTGVPHKVSSFHPQYLTFTPQTYHHPVHRFSS